jgi:hypothetical protein
MSPFHLSFYSLDVWGRVSVGTHVRVRVALVKRFPLSFCKVTHVKLTDKADEG